MVKDTIQNKYSFHSTRLVSNFQSPIDAVQLDTSIYVIEIGGSSTSSLWRIDFPKENTGIIENGKNPFVIYPNPFKDNLQIQFGNNSKGSIQIKLFDISARLVKNFVIKNFQSTIILPVSTLIEGTYLLEIRNGDNVYHQKIIKE
jgi:hypothetical protein